MSQPNHLPKPTPVHSFTLALIILLVFSGCQPAPGPTRPSGTASPTAIKTGNSLPATRTAAPTSKTSGHPRSTLDLHDTLGFEAAELRNTTVEFWHAWNGKAGDAVDELITQFNETNEWGIEVAGSQVGSYDELGDQMEAALQKNDPPDLVAAYTYQAQNWAPGENLLVDLNNYLDLPQWGLDPEEQADFYPAFWEHEVVRDRRIGIPAQRSGVVLFYNQSWAKELGFESPPNTPQEFKEQACAAAQANRISEDPANDQRGGWIISSEYPAILGWLHAYESQIIQPEGKGYRFNTAEVKDTFSFLHQVYKEGCAWFAEDQPVEDEFAQRQGLFASGSVADIPYQLAAFRRAGNRDRWTAIPFPSDQGDAAISVYGPSYLLIKSTPQEQLAAWLFTRWLASPINQAKMVEATGTFPLRISTLEYLREFRPPLSSQWQAALDLLPASRSEPNYRSWNEVRWAVSDAATQLFRWYFTIDQLPATLKLLDRTAAELHKRYP